MKCHGRVVLSSSRNSVSGRIDAATIAFSTEPASVGTRRICATCDLAVGVKSSAAMTATIWCPSANQAQAGYEKRSASKKANRTILVFIKPKTLDAQRHDSSSFGTPFLED